MTHALLTTKDSMYVQPRVDRENAMTANHFEHVTMKNKDKAQTPLRVRRNGKTKTWKRKPEEFSIPIKYGLYEYSYITHLNCNEWTVVS